MRSFIERSFVEEQQALVERIVNLEPGKSLELVVMNLDSVVAKYKLTVDVVNDDGKWYSMHKKGSRKKPEVHLSFPRAYIEAVVLHGDWQEMPRRFNLKELQDMETIHASQFHNLKYETATTRVWLSRLDKSVYNHETGFMEDVPDYKVTVEKVFVPDGIAFEVDTYEAK